jgi:hypothetical protein
MPRLLESLKLVIETIYRIEKLTLTQLPLLVRIY